MNQFNKITSFAVAFLLPTIGVCQNQTHQESATYFTNALFLTLLVTAVILAIVIAAFSSVFKNIADSDYLSNKYKNQTDNQSNAVKNITTVVLLFLSFSMFSQENSILMVKDDGRIGGIDQFTFYFMVFIIFIELLVLGLMIFQFNFLIKTHTAIASDTKIKKVESQLLMSLTDAVSVEEEEKIMLDHDYDGIKELDNNLPPWWKYGFYLTIVVAFIYLINYHVLRTGDLQGKEYEKEIAKAKLEVEEFMKNSANNVDESTVKLLTESTDIEAGKEVFISNCAACHGKLGEGSVGPNFADDYWIHGGSIQEIFKSIKYGWVEKGMKSWKEDLSPIQIAQVTSYIKTLRGTNPPNAKAPQGDLYVEYNAVNSKDTLASVADSLSLHANLDSLNTGKK